MEKAARSRKNHVLGDPLGNPDRRPTSHINGALSIVIGIVVNESIRIRKAVISKPF